MTPISQKEPPLSPQDAHHRALELVYAGRLNRRHGYCEVPSAAFLAGADSAMPELPAVAFYRLDPSSSELEEIRGPEQPFSSVALSLHRSVWVREDELEIVRKFAENLILRGPAPQASKATGPQGPDAAQGAEAASREKRIETLRRSAILVCEDLFNDPSPENISRSVKLVGSFVYVLMKDPKAYLLLSKLSSHDPYTLQHSVGTAVHAVILGRKLGIQSEAELNELGVAGLLHDIGKTRVAREIINKNGPLNELEWEEMRGHPSAGYELVRDNPDVPERAKRAILEHHEDHHGTGYPLGKKAAETDLFSRIVGISDIFNALTTDRSYSKARPPFDAFQLMREKLAHKIDSDLFQKLVTIYGGRIE